jgi:two-component sensor histidine kinase
MAEREAASAGAMRFLAGESEMARMIQAKDWTAHPLGAPETWPQALRAALGICLHSAFPTAIYWGPELRLLYNDAWSTIPGPRHPAALGAPAREVWHDIWHVIAPQFERVLAAGEGLFLRDQLLPMRRYGAPEETYWSYSFTAIRDGQGAVAGVFNSGHETTAEVLGERRMRFLLDVNEALRRASDPREAQRAAAAKLGAHLRAARVGFVELGPDGDRFERFDEWRAPGVAPTAASALSEFGPVVVAELAAGRALRIDDAAGDARLGGRAVFAAAGIGAAVAVPWMRAQALAGLAYVHAAAPRDWHDVDVATLEEVMERTRREIERARAEERERIMAREIDHRARNALAVAQSVIRLTDAPDVPAFRRKIEARIGAMSRAHAMLAAERWTAIDLGALVAQELAPYAADDEARARAWGPPVALPAALAHTAALVLHELATNAAKHGALARPEGALEVRWSAGGGRLAIDWRERGGAPAAEPSRRRGFGSVLMRRVVEAQLRGKIDWRLEPEGLVCRIELPLEEEEAGGPAEARPARLSGRPAAAPPRVLLVEDEALVAMDIEAILERLGCDLFGVYAALPEALAAVAEDRPDLAVIDANLRGRSAEPLAARLAAMGVPVVVATGYGAEAELPGALQGAPRLEKPVDEAKLARAVAAALDGRRPDAAAESG